MPREKASTGGRGKNTAGYTKKNTSTGYTVKFPNKTDGSATVRKMVKVGKDGSRTTWNTVTYNSDIYSGQLIPTKGAKNSGWKSKKIK
jgi:hypothetical protein